MRKQRKVTIRLRKEKTNGRSGLTCEQIAELIEIAPLIFTSNYKVVSLGKKTKKESKSGRIAKEHYESLYKKLVANYKKHDRFTVESSYKKLFGDAAPTMRLWKEFLDVLIRKGMVQNEDKDSENLGVSPHYPSKNNYIRKMMYILNGTKNAIQKLI